MNLEIITGIRITYFFYYLDWTKDVDKKILVDLINENVEGQWDKIKIDKRIRCYKKKLEHNPTILIKTIATINDYSKEEIYNAIANVEIRKRWDTLFSEFKIVEENKYEKSEILYMSLKVSFNCKIDFYIALTII